MLVSFASVAITFLTPHAAKHVSAMKLIGVQEINLTAHSRVCVSMSLPAAADDWPDPRKLTGWIARSSGTKDALALHERHHSAMNHIHISALWTALGRHSQRAAKGSKSRMGYVRYRPMPASVESMMLPLMRQTAEMALAGELGGREAANAMYGAANCRIPDGPNRNGLFDALCASAERTSARLKPQEFSNAMWALATAGHRAPSEFYATLAAGARESIDGFKPQELCNLAWAYSTAKVEAPALFDDIARAAVVQVHEFRPQNLANLAWAFATNSHAAPLLMDALADASTVQISAFSSQNLANIIWAFSTADHAAPQLYNAVAAQVGRKVGKPLSFKPQELAQMAWGFAKAGHRAPQLYASLAEVAVARGVSDFKPQAVASTAWAYSFAGIRSPMLFDALAAVGEPQMHDFRPQSLSMTAWAFASADHASPYLFSTIAQQATLMARDGTLRAQEVTHLAWAYAKMDHAAPELLDALAQAALRIADDFAPAQATMLMEAFDMAGHSSSPALAAAFGASADASPARPPPPPRTPARPPPPAHSPPAESTAGDGRMSWNEFRASMKGKGLAISEVSRLYKEYKATTTGSA